MERVLIGLDRDLARPEVGLGGAEHVAEGGSSGVGTYVS
jgi:hypothetical protein